MRGKLLLIMSVLLSGFAACSPQPAQDEVLQQQVTAAIASISDLPGDSLSVRVNNGVVTVTGSLACEDCGGMRTPATVGSIQQSLGAVVRAVPGVTSVEFNLTE